MGTWAQLLYPRVLVSFAPSSDFEMRIFFGTLIDGVRCGVFDGIVALFYGICGISCVALAFFIPVIVYFDWFYPF